MALDAHTDNTYFTDPAGLQMFHLLSHNEGEGGKSLLVDGVSAVQELKRISLKSYYILKITKVGAHASGNQGISIVPAFRKFPTIVNDRSDGIFQIRWNNADRAIDNFGDTPAEAWYDAARQWATVLKDPKFQYWEQLRPGRPLS